MHRLEPLGWFCDLIKILFPVSRDKRDQISSATVLCSPRETGFEILAQIQPCATPLRDVEFPDRTYTWFCFRGIFYKDFLPFKNDP